MDQKSDRNSVGVASLMLISRVFKIAEGNKFASIKADNGQIIEIILDFFKKKMYQTVVFPPFPVFSMVLN